MRIFPLLFLCLPSLGVLAAEPQDTTAERMLNLKEVVVTATVPQIDVIPAQKLSGEELKRLNSNSVADALRYFSGVQVKDYGGVGGIKTVNIRSMGTNHTGVVYDGVELGNAQNGQVDLGQFSLDNIDGISLYNGQKSEILQPAKDFGSAGSIYIRTRTPEFNGGETYHLRATLRAGSFDLLNPSALLELKLSDKVNASLSAEWINSSGKYKFRYRRVNPAGELAYDTTAVRQNGDINATRLEANLNGVVKSGQWHFKVYNYNSERGVPGAIVNNVWRRGERIWDTNSFAQVNYTQTFGKFTTLNNLKYAFYRTHYVNNDDKQIKIDNLYKQKEVYFSSANEYVLFPWWHVSAAYDFQWNTLDADVYGLRNRPLLKYAVGCNSVRPGQVKGAGERFGYIYPRFTQGTAVALRQACADTCCVCVIHIGERLVGKGVLQTVVQNAYVQRPVLCRYGKLETQPRARDAVQSWLAVQQARWRTGERNAVQRRCILQLR